MNRRGFLTGILKAGIGAAILPGALTYQRKWVKSGEIVRAVYPIGLNPVWVMAPYEIIYLWNDGVTGLKVKLEAKPGPEGRYYSRQLVNYPPRYNDPKDFYERKLPPIPVWIPTV